MKTVKVKDVFIKDCFVHVKLDDSENYEMIYRAAKGVYWDENSATLFFKGNVSQEDAIYFISEAMKNEYYTTLVFE